MTWGSRSGRVAVLAPLAVGWAVAGHTWGGPTTHADPVSSPGAVLWSLLATALVAALVPLRGATGVGLVLGAGQLLTHASLSVAPLLAGQVRHGTHGGAHGAGPGAVVTGGPDPDALVAALGHGGAGMATAHLVATVAAAWAWAVARALWAELGRWLSLAATSLPHPAPVRRTPSTGPSPVPRSCPRAFSWAGRAPPLAA